MYSIIVKRVNVIFKRRCRRRGRRENDKYTRMKNLKAAAAKQRQAEVLNAHPVFLYAPAEYAAIIVVIL